MFKIKLYDDKEEEMLLIDSSINKPSSLNYDGNDIYYILNDALWCYSLTLNRLDKKIDLPINSKYLQIINNWFYFKSGNDLYRISPITNEYQKIN